MSGNSSEDPKQAAREAGLRYVDSNGPGIRRKKRGRAFTYIGVDGKTVRDQATRERIKTIAIPPAWTDIWISPIAHGHLQATGRDGSGRKQYKYHVRWRDVRDGAKYEHVIGFARSLPKLRRSVRKDLSKPGLPREKVIAAVVRLLETTLIRVGNDEYARQNDSYGLTTLRDKHVRVNGSSIEFQFVGKGGQKRNVDLRDKTLAKIVKRCRDIPGYDLFQYYDEAGERRTVQSDDVNEYLRAATGEGFTAKDFRTWAGTLLAAIALREFEEVDSEAQAKSNVLRAVERVAGRLGNTPTICRKCYVHPEILDAYMNGEILAGATRNAKSEVSEGMSGLDPEEAAVLALLEKRLRSESKQAV